MKRIKSEEDITTKILMKFIDQGMKNDDIVMRIVKACDFNVDTREIYTALSFLRIAM